MTSKQQRQKKPEQVTVQPATRERVKVGVADDKSSKVASTHERDARSGHDKDSNQEQLKRVGGGRRS